MRLHRVLDRERMQVELGRQRQEFVLRGAGEADPRHAGRPLAQLAEGLGEAGGGGDADTVPVQGRLDDARGPGRLLGLPLGRPGLARPRLR